MAQYDTSRVRQLVRFSNLLSIARWPEWPNKTLTNSEALCFYDEGKMFMPLDRQIRDVPTSINFDVWADNFNITHIIHSFKKSL